MSINLASSPWRPKRSIWSCFLQDGRTVIVTGGSSGEAMFLEWECVSTAVFNVFIWSRAKLDKHRERYIYLRDIIPETAGPGISNSYLFSGMGYYCAENIAKKGGHVIIAARSLERSQKAADLIKARNLQICHHFTCDAQCFTYL